MGLFTAGGHVGIADNIPAEERINHRIVLAEDAFASIVIWRLPGPLRGSSHPYKVRLAYVVGGVCVLRYDNEAGKGDLRHCGEVESPYVFVDAGRLRSDFAARHCEVEP